MEKERRDFESVAARWDSNPGRVRIANEVATAIRRSVALSPHMAVLDYGCGTGLLSLQLLPQVGSLCGADSSPAMLEVMAGKIAAQGISNARTQFVDFEHGAHASGSYDLIVSSMVTHHVPDTAALFAEWFRLLNPGGQIAFADLDSEDGAFHGDNTGVFHLGFDRTYLRELLQKASFSEVRDSTATSVSKEVEGQQREFPIFLIVARKP
ncbi:MAG: class I SAM-dependent methyltransferase [Gammaproteobacteria bacterium]|nr:class I SAM-dependent methyltransferase [Sideroxydans sp.]MBU3903661.1 class I SAM-dependent methyltransferase [Gammaproteobacteria bacterium]MBU4045595.1 class I SAM-dependent methyltransferase [Gammaproteobacteria bacterium]MBU4150328.1 class I SAM-dependent methyltransferase [Gammaproteobacteria bacterium]